MRQLVAFSGLPASGKTTLGAVLAKALGFRFLDKDDFLEALFHAHGKTTIEERNTMSRKADEQFKAAAQSENSAVVASWWRHPKSVSTSGTEPWWVSTSIGTVVEVHCLCSPELAAARFIGRTRLPGHNDQRWNTSDLLELFTAQALYGPLLPEKAIVYNTEDAVGHTAMLTQMVQIALQHKGVA